MPAKTVSERRKLGRVAHCRSVRLALLSASILSLAECNMYAKSMRGSSLSGYNDDGLDAEYGFDRLAVMRVQVQDQTEFYSGAITTLKAIATGTKGQGGLVGVSADALDYFQAEGGWSSGAFDGLAVVESKVDSISVNALRLARLGMRDEIDELVMPLGGLFALQRGCLNYLGRLHVLVQKVGSPRPAFAQPSFGWTIRETRTVQYALWLEQGDKVMQEDIESIHAQYPKLRNELTCSVRSNREVRQKQPDA
jgi:hypothetical protein